MITTTTSIENEKSKQKKTWYQLHPEWAINQSIQLKKKYSEHPELRLELSRRMKEWHKTHKNPMLGVKMPFIPKSEEHKRKLSLSKMGDKNPMRNPIHARKMALTKKGKTIPKLKEYWALNKPKQIKAMMRGLKYAKPNKLEKKLIDIIEKNNLQFKYVGTGEFRLGNKSPDFLNINGKKQVIELFGNYWHGVRARETGEDRIQHFKKYGFNTLIIWENELKNEQMIVEKIKNFAEVIL